MGSKMLGFHPAEEALEILNAEEAILLERLKELRTKRETLEASIAKIQKDRFSRGRPLLHTLPPELTRRIVDYLSIPTCTCGRNSCTHPARVCTEPLTRVSRAMREIFEPYLYEHIVLWFNSVPYPSLSNGALLVRTLVGRPELQGLVRHLEITKEARSEFDFELMAICTSLVSIKVPDSDYALYAPQGLRKLAISSEINIAALMPVVPRLTDLESLEVRQKSDDLFGFVIPTVVRTFADSAIRRLKVNLCPGLPQTMARLLSGVGQGLDVLEIDNAYNFQNPSESTDMPVTNEEAAKSTVRLLFLDGWYFAPDSQNLFRSLSWQGTLAKFTSLRQVHIHGGTDDSAHCVIPEVAFSQLPPAIETLGLYFREPPDDWTDVSSTLPSLVSAWSRSPHPERRIARIELRFVKEQWRQHVDGFREACRGAGIALQVKFASEPERDEDEDEDDAPLGRRMELDPWHTHSPRGRRVAESIVIQWEDVADS